MDAKTKLKGRIKDVKLRHVPRRDARRDRRRKEKEKWEVRIKKYKNVSIMTIAMMTSRRHCRQTSMRCRGFTGFGCAGLR